MSQKLAARVAEKMVSAGLGVTPPGCVNWEAYVASKMWTLDRLEQQERQWEAASPKIMSKL